MLKVIVRRVVSLVPIVLMATVIVFVMMQLTPGDPAVQAAGGEAARPADVERIREQLGLDDPWLVQYMRWASAAVRGDLGTSFRGGFAVADQIQKRLPVTISITFGAIIVALLIAMPAGMLAAARSGSWIDRLVTIAATTGIAAPNFFVGLLLAMFFGRYLGWLPAVGYRSLAEHGPVAWLSHILLPSIALGTAVAAEMARHLRASLRDALNSDYIRTARSLGIREPTIVGKFALKNAALPLITVLGLQIRNLLGGAAAVELVFALDGFGDLAVRAVFDRDYPMLQGILFVSVLVVVGINLLVDITYGYFNPKVRSS